MEPSRFASSVVTQWGYKAGMVTLAQATSYRTISHYFSAYFPMAEKKEKIEKQI
jgi:hypothetical protein